VKKKFELEHLRDQAASLHKENEALKRLISAKLPSPVSASILIECDVQLPDNVSAIVQSLVSKLDCTKLLMIKNFKNLQRSFCITNACAFDNPIVYASPGFVELTGYPITEIIGRNCRFLQGPDTDKTQVCFNDELITVY
jgi:PAS domain-containing protein